MADAHGLGPCAFGHGGSNPLPGTKGKMTLQKQQDGSIEFEISIPWGTVHQAYQEVLQETAKHAEIKGFRKGKAPLALAEKSLDTSKLYSHALEHLLPKEYAKALKKHDVKPIIEPRLTLLETKEEKPWRLKIETAEKPEVDLGNYTSYIKKTLKSIKKASPSPKSQDDTQQREDPRLTALFDALLVGAKLQIAPLLIEEELRSALSRLINQLEPLKISLDDYAKSLKKTRDELVDEYRKTAENTLRLEFILDALIADVNPPVSDKEVASLQPKPDQKEYAKYVLKRRKVIDKLLEL